MLEVHGPQDRVVSSREYRDGISHDESWAEMMAITCQIAGIFRAEYKQGIQVGIVERVLGALQTFPQHPLRIKSHFPIDWNHSNVRQSEFLLENKCTLPL